jgi:two-component system, chemotaxis family, chemotaxis protein CheY
MRNCLEQMGLKDIEEAENGKVALDTLNAGKFDLLISDWNMPVMTGPELLRSVKGSDTLKHIQVVMVTTEAGREYIVEAIEAGAAGYIVKPYTPALVVNRLKGLLKLA